MIRKEVGVHASWLLAGKLIQFLLAFIVGVLVVRYLGPYRFGELSFSLSFVAILAPVSKLGLDSIVVKQLVEKPSKQSLILGSAAMLKLIAVLFVVGTCFTTSFYMKADATVRGMIAIILLGQFLTTFDVGDFYFQSNLAGKFLGIGTVTSSVMSACYRVFLIVTHKSLIWFAMAVVVELTVKAIVSLYFLHARGLSPAEWKFSFPIAKTLLKQGSLLLFSAVAYFIYMKIDQVMIQQFLTERDVGLYAAAVRLSEAWYVVPGVLSVAFFPVIVKFKMDGDSDGYKRVMLQVYGAFTWISVFVAILVTLFSGFLVETIFGDSYIAAAKVLAVHFWSGIFVGFLVFSGKWYVNEGWLNFLLLRNVAGAIVNIVLNLMWIPRYGIVGAAVATLISYFVAGYLFDAVSSRSRECFFQKTCGILGGGLWARRL